MISKNKSAILLGILTLLIVKEGLAWDFDKLKEDASGWIEKKKEETSGYIDRKKEEASDYIERKREDVSDWSREKSEELKKKGEDWSERTRERIGKESERVREKTKSFYEDTKEKASEYIRKYEPEIKEKAERAKEEFVGFLKDSDKQKDIIEKIRRFDRAKQEVEIGLIKALPVYDPRDGKVKTFDRFMREMVGELGGGSLGGDLAKDPVRTGYLMCVDTDYFLKMDIIPGPEDGQLLSINEALKAGYKTSDVEQLREEYYAMKEAFRDNDAESLNRHLTYFSNELSKIQPQRRRDFIIKENITNIASRLGLLLVFLILILGAVFSIKFLLSDSTQIYCRQCNYRNEKGSKFCEECGNGLFQPKKKRKLVNIIIGVGISLLVIVLLIILFAP